MSERSTESQCKSMKLRVSATYRTVSFPLGQSVYLEEFNEDLICFLFYLSIHSQYHRFHDCAVEVYTDDKHSNVCSERAVQELESYITESMYDVLQYLCGDYQEYSDKCDNLLNKYKDVWRSVKVGSRPKSPLTNANEVFDSVPPI